MGLYDISSTTNSEMSGNLTEVLISPQDTSISLYSPDWTKWHGIYREVPEIQTTIDKVSFWSAGKGVIAKEPGKQKQLDKITGDGKDTIRDIVINLMRTARICGDSFASITWNTRGELINLKVLSPGSIEIETDNRGIITKYRQISYKGTGTERQKIILETWEPEEMFHLCWNRIADETHGISTIEKLEPIIKKRKRAQEIIDTMYERLIYPIRIIEADTDDPIKLAELKEKYKEMIDKKEIMIVPKDSMKFDSSTVQILLADLLEWPNYLQKYFVMSEGVPEVILGSINSKDTEGASKILYLAYEQVIKNSQNYFEEQWKSQIGFEIDLPEPPSLNPVVVADNKKSGSMDASKGNNNMSSSGNMSPKDSNK
jgi:hypothetical protein